MVQSLNLAVNFFLNTYLKYKKKDSAVIVEWVNCIETIISQSEEAAAWLLKYLADAGPSVIKLYLLECPSREVRHTFVQILDKAFLFSHRLERSESDVNRVLGHLINFLDQDVADNCWHSSQYFCLLSGYSRLGVRACGNLFKLDAFQKLLSFLLGPLSANMDCEDSFGRRWSHAQIHEFGHLHSTLVSLVLFCDLTSLYTCEAPPLVTREALVRPPDLLELPDDVRKALCGPGAWRYIREVVSACRETSGPIDMLVHMLVQC
ncbi:hypothetical protein IscW_ISCW010219, partial [Ixodes scapularis]